MGDPTRGSTPASDSQTPSRESSLSTPLQYVKGVGPQRALFLQKLGLKTVRDLLFYFPRDYQDLCELHDLQQFEAGKTMRVVATIEEFEMRETGGGRSVIGALLKQQDNYFRAVWFNQPYIFQQLTRGARVVATGTAKNNGFRWEMHHPKLQMLPPDETPPPGGLLPVYRLTEGISQQQLRQIIATSLERYASEVEEIFPPRLLDLLQLWPIGIALKHIHLPADAEHARQARHRFVYQELFLMQLALGLRKSASLALPSPTFPCDGRLHERIRRLFPFPLTRGQEGAVQEILADMARTVPMNRLLQGDVGTGKTVVAAYAMLVAVAHQYQAVVMAPTEILAQQHFHTFSRLLAIPESASDS